MATEHHIDSFDLPAFFKLHDLDMDGFWDRGEIAAIYGLRHHSVIGKKDEHNIPAGMEDTIVAAVLAKLDSDGDGECLWRAGAMYTRTICVLWVLDPRDRRRHSHIGKISQAEYVAAGANSLPVFDNHKDLGHHYDEESE